MTLTNWYRYEPSREMKSQWTAVWVKISSSWIGIVLYVWTLVAPLVLTNRDFDWVGLLAWKSHFDYCLFENSIPNFCKVVYVCASHVTSPVFWHELDFTACHFICYFLAKCIDMWSRMNCRGKVLWIWWWVSKSGHYWAYSLLYTCEMKSKNKIAWLF